MSAHPDFTVQRVQDAPDHWRIICKHCRRAWLLPKAEHRRTKEAPEVLREHAAEHAADKPIAIKPLPFVDARGEPTSDQGQSYWSRRERQRRGTEDPLAVNLADRERAARFVEAVMSRFGTGEIIVRKLHNYSELRRDNAARTERPASLAQPNGKRRNHGNRTTQSYVHAVGKIQR